jgi:DNA repair photolyase
MGEYQGREAWRAFEHRIFVKRRDTVLAALERDLARVNRRRSAGETVEIVLGTATDPYQPAERTYQLSRLILQRLARERGLAVGIISKSPLVCRDIDVLREVQRHNALSIHVSLISTNVRLIKVLEARSPMPHARLRGLHKLTEAGLNAGVIVAPVLPGINDTVAQIEELIVAAKSSGTRFAFPSALRLYSSIRDHFLPVIDRHFPGLSAKYREAYRGLGHAPRAYAAALAKRFGEIAARHGVPVKHHAAVASNAPARKPGTQLGLWER